MTDRDIEAEGRELVIKADGRVKRSPVPDGFAPAMFRHIVAAADLLYRKNGQVPNINQLMSSWEGFDKKTLGQAIASPEYKAALKLRGIEFDLKQGLTAEQLYVVQLLQDPSDRRTVKARVESVGVSMGQYRAWMRNPAFSAAMREQSEQNLGDAPQMALNRLIAAADAGDLRAIEKVLEISGRYNPQQQGEQNARTVVMILMEVLQSKIKDKELLREILDEVRSRQSSLTIVQSLKELS